MGAFVFFISFFLDKSGSYLEFREYYTHFKGSYAYTLPSSVLALNLGYRKNQSRASGAITRTAPPSQNPPFSNHFASGTSSLATHLAVVVCVDPWPKGL